jgi:hypothetical protein
VYGLLRLCECYGHDRVNALCERALAFDTIAVLRLEGMLRDARRTEDAVVVSVVTVKVLGSASSSGHSMSSQTTSRCPGSTLSSWASTTPLDRESQLAPGPLARGDSTEALATDGERQVTDRYWIARRDRSSLDSSGRHVVGFAELRCG